MGSDPTSLAKRVIKWAVGRVDEFTASRVQRFHPSVVQDSIEGQVSRDSVVSLSYIKPKAIKGEWFFVVLIGYFGTKSKFPGVLHCDRGGRERTTLFRSTIMCVLHCVLAQMVPPSISLHSAVRSVPGWFSFRLRVLTTRFLSKYMTADTYDA
jgi:hypothetical protein